MHDKKAVELPEVRHQSSGSPFSIRILDAQGQELSKAEEPTLHAALARARQRLREHIDVEGHKAEVRRAQELIYDVFAESGPGRARSAC